MNMDNVKKIKFAEEFIALSQLHDDDTLMVGVASDGMSGKATIKLLKDFIKGNSEENFDKLKFDSDVVVTLPDGYTFGKYKNGDIIPARGKFATDVIKDALTMNLAPSFTMSVDSELKETGNSNPNLISYEIDRKSDLPILNLKIGSTIIPVTGGDQSGVLSVNEQNTTVGVRTYNGLVIDAENTVTSQVKVRYDNYYYFGSVGDLELRVVDIKLLPKQFTSLGDRLSYRTGLSDRNFVIACPVYKELDTVIDVGNGNTAITQNFEKVIMQVNDSGNNDIPYNVYVLRNGVPYSESTTHRITMKDV